jgi:hypothetical protein
MRFAIVATSAFAASLAAGCGSQALTVAIQGDAGTTSDATGAFSSNDAGEVFTADIENTSHVVLTTATLACNGDCIDVQAVAGGGNAPFTYRWSDGMTGASRHLCPTSMTTFTVSITDTARAGEIGSAAQTVTASIALSCSDGGAGTTGGQGPCIENPLLDGTPAAVGGTATDWDVCAPANAATFTNPDAPGSNVVTPPSAGKDFAFIAPGGSISNPLCAPMQAGMQYGLLIDLASAQSISISAASGLQIWGGSSSCAQSELLYSSPPTGQSWKTFCATLAPTQETTELTFTMFTQQDGGLPIPGYLIADNLVPVASCQ